MRTPCSYGPEAVLAGSDSLSFDWRLVFIRTFLERDIPQFGFTIPAITMRRFWTMLAHYHSQMLNASKFGQALGVSHPTIKHSWIVAPVAEPYPKYPGVTVTNIKGVLQDIRK